MVFAHYILLLLAILPLVYRFSFWLYLIQLKEYRWDRIKEYLNTPQGNSAMFNFLTVIELPLFLVSFVIFIDNPFEIIIFNVLYIFLIMQNLFVLRKIITRRMILPKFTSRLLLTSSIIFSFLFLITSIIHVFELNRIIYSFILSVLVFSPLYILIAIYVTLPIVNKLKNKKIINAINKSIKHKNTVKVGITGSYGKSSVKEFLASMLFQDGKTLFTPANVNTELGVADIVLKKLSKEYKYFVAEMGAYKIGEIETLGKIVDHKYGFLTAIGNQHLGLFGSQYNIQKGKSEIANSVLKNKGKLYINRNDKFIRKIEFDKKLSIVKYGSFRGSDAAFSILSTKNGITEFTLTYKGKTNTFSTDLIGKHNIINLSGVIACCYDLGISTRKISKYLKNVKAPKNTLAIINTEKHTLIDDTYNLSEDGLYAGLDVIKSFEGQKILVIDDILELGSGAKEIHYILGKFIAGSSPIDKVLYCGVNYKKAFIKGLEDGGFDMRNILKVISNVSEGSIILFEGRNSNKYLKKIAG